MSTKTEIQAKIRRLEQQIQSLKQRHTETTDAKERFSLLQQIEQCQHKIECLEMDAAQIGKRKKCFIIGAAILFFLLLTLLLYFMHG